MFVPKELKESSYKESISPTSESAKLPMEMLESHDKGKTDRLKRMYIKNRLKQLRKEYSKQLSLKCYFQ
jgi:hypothetical protein